MVKTTKQARGWAGPGTGLQPPALQVAALCWRRSRKGLRVLLITSRDSGRWVIPKGWPMRNRSEAETAAREAFEEAGLRGQISDRSIGLYTYLKGLAPGRSILCAVKVFPLEVREMLTKYPETGQRRARWFSPEKAAKRIAEPELKAIIRGFDPDAGDAAAAGRHAPQD
jgi:8-oxo-dGTP pyrophosphatase MutT (NUDIX family)